MNEPWFDPIYYAWIPGTLLGTLGGIWGSLIGTLAPRGKGKVAVLTSLGILLAASVAFLALGIMALVAGQPYGVWYGLLLPASSASSSWAHFRRLPSRPIGRPRCGRSRPGISEDRFRECKGPASDPAPGWTTSFAVGFVSPRDGGFKSCKANALRRMRWLCFAETAFPFRRLSASDNPIVNEPVQCAPLVSYDMNSRDARQAQDSGMPALPVVVIAPWG